MIYLAVLIALHIVSALAPKLPSRIISVINIVFHSVLILPLMYYSFSLEEAVLVYMISLTAYTVISFVCYKSDEKRRARSIAFFEKYKAQKANKEDAV